MNIIGSKDSVAAQMTMLGLVGEALFAPKIRYQVQCRNKHGDLLWEEDVENLVTTVGKTDILDKYLKGSGYTAAWYMGLKNSTDGAVGDTLATKSWTEDTNYSGGPTRKTITWGTTTSGSNTGTAVTFSINATTTIGGAFVCTVSTGTSGTLYSVSEFSVDRSVANGDTLNVTPTLSIT
jgi:hypothetical protein